jgi:Zn-dependent protease with chaperone function
MDFYTHQDNARRKSRALVWRFCLANIILLGLLNASLYFLMLATFGETVAHTGSARTLLSKSALDLAVPLMFPLDLLTLAAIVIAAATQFRRLSAAGGAVAEALGALRVPPDTTDPLERRYLNVVEEMAIAANVPVPEVYILAEEEGINAFASGPSLERSAVAVTRGALERLNRDELQGVIAHEFSHITHGDVPLNIKLSSFVYGLLVLYSIGRFILELVMRSSRSRSRSDSGAGAAPVAFIAASIGFIFIVFGFIGRLLAVLMSAAISRQREFLADATAVQFTRNPAGIAGALKKIGGFEKGATIRNSRAVSMSHFFLANSRPASFLSALYSSHPPLVERISRLDSSFTGTFPGSSSIALQSAEDDPPIAALHGSPVFSSDQAVVHDVQRSEGSLEFLQPRWMPPTALHDTFIGLGAAESAILAILLGRDPHERSRQREIASRVVAIQEIDGRLDMYESLSVNQRLSIVMMAMPSLHGEARTYRESFQRTVTDLIRVDGQVNRLEFLVGTLVEFALDSTATTDSLWTTPKRPSKADVVSYVATLLSVCASFASNDEGECCSLVEGAANHLGISCSYDSSCSDDIPGFTESLRWLRSMSEPVRLQVMAAVDYIVQHDQNITELETALERIFAMLLRADLNDASQERTRHWSRPSSDSSN